MHGTQVIKYKHLWEMETADLLEFYEAKSIAVSEYVEKSTG